MWIENGKPPVPKPKGLKPIFENIPDELKNRDNWILWRYLQREVANPPRDRKIKIWTKKPYGWVDDSETWNSFDDVVDMYEDNDGDGIGFVFKQGDGLVGIDLDDVIDDEGNTSRRWERMALEARTFTELSPSGNGLHLYLNAELLGGKRKNSIGLEIYGGNHYFTVTGHIPSFCKCWDVTENQGLVDYIHKKITRDETPACPVPSKKPNYNNPNEDDEVIGNIFSSADVKAQDLFNGNWEEYYPSHSEADLGFFKKLLYWTYGDVAQAERIFEKSGLNRQKWSCNYKKTTIRKAVSYK